MKNNIWRIMIFIICFLLLETNVYAEKTIYLPSSCGSLRTDGKTVAYDKKGDSNCQVVRYQSCGGSVMPGADTRTQCCSNGYTSLSHDEVNGSTGCVSCGSTPCRLCKHTGLSAYLNRFGFQYEMYAVPESAIPSLLSKNSTRTDKVYCDEVVYADTNYSNSNNNSCRLYGCEPIPLEVCWIKNSNGNQEYEWTTVRPGGAEWQADFDKTKDTCNDNNNSTKYCYVKYGYGSENQYKMDKDATEEWQLCNSSSNECNNCSEEEKCYKKNDGNLVWGKYKNQNGYTLQSSISYANCYTITTCNPISTSPSGSNVTSGKCEDNLKKTYSSGISCDTTKTRGFYNITCTTTINPVFDFGDNESVTSSPLVLYKGQGFGFGINMNITNKCIGTFNSSIWENAYGSFLTNSSDLKEDNRNKKIIAKLKEKVDVFNNWTPENSNLDSPTIGLTFAKKNIQMIKVEEFTINTSKTKTSTKNLKNTDIYAKEFIYTESKTIKYRLPQVQLDKLTGEIKESGKNLIDGGHKIYVDLNAEEGTYPINISISNLKDGKTITNNKCSVQVISSNSLYRIIEVSNPFVNDTRKKPENWMNDTYDFTKIIANSNSNSYTFNLTKSEISELQANNRSIGNNYLGTCDGNKAGGVIGKICNIINAGSSTEK